MGSGGRRRGRGRSTLGCTRRGCRPLDGRRARRGRARRGRARRGRPTGPGGTGRVQPAGRLHGPGGDQWRAPDRRGPDGCGAHGFRVRGRGRRRPRTGVALGAADGRFGSCDGPGRRRHRRLGRVRRADRTTRGRGGSLNRRGNRTGRDCGRGRRDGCGR
ncbi:hypothetical protein EF909_14675 [Streptomyces sp. WAC01280]|nr:hypothetical protein EF909_14675 [Streptomyces sp. WAC01280]